MPGRQSALYKGRRSVKGVPMVFGCAQDDEVTDAGPAELFPMEADIKVPAGKFAHALTDGGYERLLAFYAAADFEPR